MWKLSSKPHTRAHSNRTSGLRRFSTSAELHSENVVVGFSGTKFTVEGELLNEKLNGELKRLVDISSEKPSSKLEKYYMEHEDLKCTTFFGLAGGIKRLAVVNMGHFGELTPYQQKQRIRIASGIGSKAISGAGAKNISIDSFGDIQAATEGAILGLHKFGFKTKLSESTTESNIKTFVPKYPSDSHQSPYSFPQFDALQNKIQPLNATKDDHFESGKINAFSQIIAREVAETPGNLMTPTIFADIASNILTPIGSHVCVTVHNQDWIENQKMGCFLGVSQGSAQPPKFVEIHIKSPDAKVSPTVFVGKGITFDSGGISLKPSSNMAHMKGDMSGAAAVLGSMWGIANYAKNGKIKEPYHFIGLIPLCENMPSSKACKPGDILVASNGKTVEVDNTDAEGRLILADALHYAHRFEPESITDLATLTGAIDVALGGAFTGAFSTDTPFFNELDQSAQLAGEPIWRMPLTAYYAKKLKSNIADLVNSPPGLRSGGASLGAAFLKEFVTVKRYCHLDIASTFMTSGKGYSAKGMNGVGVRTLIQYALSKQ